MQEANKELVEASFELLKRLKKEAHAKEIGSFSVSWDAVADVQGNISYAPRFTVTYYKV
jgi:hypothetical protein